MRWPRASRKQALRPRLGPVTSLFTMLKTLRPASFAALAVAATVAVAGCGSDDSVPSDAVAKAGDPAIRKPQSPLGLPPAAGQRAHPPARAPAAVVAPDPPNYTKCAAAKAQQKTPK